MATTDFTTGTTIASTWLNDVDDFVYSTGATKAGTQTLTNKTVDLTDNTVTGTMAEFDTACSDGNFAYLTSGTFTPTVTFSTPGDLAVTYVTRTGTYTRVGDMVYLNISIVTSAFTHTTASGNLWITGFNFTGAGASSSHYRMALDVQGGIAWPAGSTMIMAYATGGLDYIKLEGTGSASAGGDFTVTQFPTTSSVNIEINGWMKV